MNVHTFMEVINVNIRSMSVLLMAALAESLTPLVLNQVGGAPTLKVYHILRIVCSLLQRALTFFFFPPYRAIRRVFECRTNGEKLAKGDNEDQLCGKRPQSCSTKY